MRWLHSITDSMGMNLSKLWEIVKSREAWYAVVHTRIFPGGSAGKESTCNVVSVFVTFLFLSAFVVILRILIIFLHPQGKAHLPLALIGHKVSFLESK